MKESNLEIDSDFNQEYLTVASTTETTDNIEILQQIHNDLGIMTCFIVFITLVIILKYTYKFFNMLFNF